MIHLGDITKINGATVPLVNAVIGGSPCQDLSIAGKRAGLAGERSGLFMEMLRVIKEMRKTDESRGRTGKDIRPRFMVWENVPGAFSSNKGADFGAVLQEIVRVVCEEAPPIPMSKNGWSKAGCLFDVDGRWSVAWRVFDAQFWGVPQRRSRIALVADFGGLGAPEILFERKSVSGYSTQSGETGEAITGTAETSTAGNDRVLETELTCYGLDRASFNQGQNAQFSFTILEDQAPTLVAKGLGAVSMPVVYSFDSLASNSMKSSNPNSGCREVDVSRTLDTTRPDPAKNQGGIAICQPVYCLQGNGIDRADTAGCNGAGWKEDVSYTLNTIDRPAVAYESKTVFDARGNGNGTVSPTITGDHENRITDYSAILVEKIIRWIVRRLTPLECERLQGFPDGWTDIGDWTDSKGKKHKGDSDSARYKALGNSIALPPWFYVLQRLSLYCGSDCTMASLFDGIGGFPLIWETLNGKGTCLWASEIEEFAIAVTSARFSE